MAVRILGMRILMDKRSKIDVSSIKLMKDALDKPTKRRLDSSATWENRKPRANGRFGATPCSWNSGFSEKS
jgi:hypothetical protein